MKIIRVILAVLLILAICASASADGLSYGIRHVSRDLPMVAITMDDCANINIVYETFQYCVEHEVYITFFPIGYNLHAKDAAIWQEIAASPWAEIGSHTMHHYCWEKCRKVTIGQELDDFSAKLDEVLGYHYDLRVVRPPHGHYSTTRQGGNASTVQAITEAHGYDHVILWDVSQTTASKCLSSVKNGSILLFHAYAKDMKCVKTIIPKLQERGLQMVTVSMLLEAEAAQQE